MATAPVFLGSGTIGNGTISTANANRDGTGTIIDLVTAAAAGTAIECVAVKAIVTTSAGTVRLFLYNGSAYRLLAEIPIVVVTVSATQPAFEFYWIPPRGLLVLPDNTWKLSAATEKAEQFNVFAFGGPLT